jgi:hypothetical protein
VSMKMAVFWVLAPCRLVWVYRRFRGLYCLHHQGATTQKTAIFMYNCCFRLIPNAEPGHNVCQVLCWHIFILFNLTFHKDNQLGIGSLVDI